MVQTRATGTRNIVTYKNCNFSLPTPVWTEIADWSITFPTWHGTAPSAQGRVRGWHRTRSSTPGAITTRHRAGPTPHSVIPARHGAGPTPHSVISTRHGAGPSSHGTVATAWHRTGPSSHGTVATARHRTSPSSHGCVASGHGTRSPVTSWPRAYPTTYVTMAMSMSTWHGATPPACRGISRVIADATLGHADEVQGVCLCPRFGLPPEFLFLCTPFLLCLTSMSRFTRLKLTLATVKSISALAISLIPRQIRTVRGSRRIRREGICVIRREPGINRANIYA
jgi:hypothetical protein